MRKVLAFLFGVFFAVYGGSGRAQDLGMDTNNPLFMIADNSFLSETTLTYWDDILRAGQTFSYGINERFSLSGNIHFQQDFDGQEDGFSSFDIGGKYRLMNQNDNDYQIISDVLFGLKFGGSSHVRTPYFADSTYYAGLRFGRRWDAVTLAGTVKSSWIFDDLRGMSYIDFVPEAYFRIAPDWFLGVNFMWRVSTKPEYDQEWTGVKIVRQYGHTQYVLHFDYEFESDDVQVGSRINILF